MHPIQDTIHSQLAFMRTNSRKLSKAREIIEYESAYTSTHIVGPPKYWANENIWVQYWLIFGTIHFVCDRAYLYGV